jgi:DNA-binding transcriptional ArsR family regulator
MDDVFWIEDMETFEVIADPTRMALLEELGSPRTVKELADAMEVPRTRLYHHIGLLVDSGVVRVVESRGKRALTERVYQATAKSYQPSEALLESADPRRQAEIVLDTLFATTRADFVRAVDGGMPLAGPSTMVARWRMPLTPDRLEKMLGELSEILTRYAGMDEEDGATPVSALTVVYRSSGAGR